MSSYTLVGNQLTSLVEHYESEVSVSDTGEVTGTLQYTGKWPGALEQALALSAHPDFSWLRREAVTVKRMEAEMAEVRITYKGIVDDGEENITKKYKLKAGTVAEPIETHPDFVVFGGLPPAGKAGTNKKGATFDDKGVFKYFAVEDDTKPNMDYYPNANKNKAGVRSYLGPNVTYTETATYSKTSRGQAIAIIANLRLCAIQTPPSSELLPNLGGDYTWLLVDASFDEVGEGIKAVRTYRLSGSRGWDLDIYTDER